MYLHFTSSYHLKNTKNMTILRNDIVIQAPLMEIWEELAHLENLEKFDPTVKRSVALSPHKTGVGAKRKVDMLDGKNWFEETCTTCEPGKSLTYELTACTFPIHQLSHSYRFEDLGLQTRVVQVMEYRMKYGLFGKILDAMLVQKQTATGIRKFFSGLKAHVEKKRNTVLPEAG